ncbi:MAG: hypothetical protein EP347_03380 [Alphaproteobacteria bacterium]|nr:MAG: hypothetical protein EP347_03380 [Alphaproteobacteria bacterium]
MNIETAYFIAQIIAALAIIGSLAYAILQIKINNRLMKIQLSHATATGIASYNQNLGLDKQAARVWRKGINGDQDLDDDEKMQFNLLCSSAFNGYESHLVLERDGLINPELADRYHAQLEHIVSRPGIKLWWSKQRANFSQHFRDEVDGLIARSIEQNT